MRKVAYNQIIVWHPNKEKKLTKYINHHTSSFKKILSELSQLNSHHCQHISDHRIEHPKIYQETKATNNFFISSGTMKSLLVFKHNKF